MKYFTEELHDIEGYHNNLLSLRTLLDKETFAFFLNDSFHDSILTEIKTLNKYNEDISDDSKKSIVSITAKLHHWDGTQYELLWEDVTKYSLDFDIYRNKGIETGQILFNRGLDEWSHDELIETSSARLNHEIILFSQTKIIIECKYLFLRKIG